MAVESVCCDGMKGALGRKMADSVSPNWSQGICTEIELVFPRCAFLDFMMQRTVNKMTHHVRD